MPTEQLQETNGASCLELHSGVYCSSSLAWSDPVQLNILQEMRDSPSQNDLPATSKIMGESVCMQVAIVKGGGLESERAQGGVKG